MYSSGVGHWLGEAHPKKCRLALPQKYILVKNEKLNCAKFTNFDRFCSQNL